MRDPLLGRRLNAGGRPRRQDRSVAREQPAQNRDMMAHAHAVWHM